MSMNRCVFTVGNDADTRKNAANVGKLFYPDAKLAIREFSDDECFNGLTQQDLGKIVMIGNASETHFGGYSAREFAKIFSRRFLESHDAKSAGQVRDLYLVGCNIGLIKDDHGSSLAQEIANEISDLGFQKVVVHSIAKPENAKGDYLYVEVLNCSGSAGLLALTSALAHRAGGGADVQTGFIKAYLLAEEDAKRIASLEKGPAKNHKEIYQIKRDKSFIIVNHANTEVELNKPHHSFYPNETPEVRKSRLNKNNTRQLAKQHAEAIALLVNRATYLSQQASFKDKMMSKKLDFLITQLRLTDEHHWQPLLTEYGRYLKNHAVYGRFYNDDVNTQKLLAAVAKNDFKAANKIIDSQNTLKTGATPRSMLPFFNRKGALPQSVVPPDMALMPYHILERIDQLSRDLSDEIDQIKSGFFGVFYTYEVNTKLAKLAVVNSLRSCQGLDAAQRIAREAMSDSRVMRSMRHSRTRDLLDDICKVKTVNSRMVAAF